jgi:hypothetical protein
MCGEMTLNGGESAGEKGKPGRIELGAGEDSVEDRKRKMHARRAGPVIRDW